VLGPRSAGSYARCAALTPQKREPDGSITRLLLRRASQRWLAGFVAPCTRTLQRFDSLWYTEVTVGT